MQKDTSPFILPFDYFGQVGHFDRFVPWNRVICGVFQIQIARESRVNQVSYFNMNARARVCVCVVSLYLHDKS